MVSTTSVNMARTRPGLEDSEVPLDLGDGLTIDLTLTWSDFLKEFAYHVFYPFSMPVCWYV
jgi:hypothetical protein